MRDGFMAASAKIETLDPRVEGVPILRETREASLHTVMSNSFGFGGTNATLVFSRLWSVPRDAASTDSADARDRIELVDDLLGRAQADLYGEGFHDDDILHDAGLFQRPDLLQDRVGRFCAADDERVRHGRVAHDRPFAFVAAAGRENQGRDQDDFHEVPPRWSVDAMNVKADR